MTHADQTTPIPTKLSTKQTISRTPHMEQGMEHGMEQGEDFLTPEQRLHIIADILSDIAIRVVKKHHEKSHQS